MSRLTKLEQETIVRFDEQGQQAEIFTYNRSLQKRLSGFCEKYPDQFSFRGDNGAGGKTFLCPKRRIGITAPRSLTPEQKEKARQNLKR